MASHAPVSESTVTFALDGRPVDARPGETILQAARRHGVDIPHLCYMDGYRADGNCRACVVEIEGERVLAPSCCREPSEGMQVRAASERALHAQRMVLELLRSDMPGQGRSPYREDSELDRWCEHLGVNEARLPMRPQPPADTSSPAIAVHLDACIQCTRCLRGCREVQGNDVIGYAHRGAASAIVFDLDDPMGESSCVSCGECVQACPTGALMPADPDAARPAERVVRSVCPFCGVGCQVAYHVRDDRVTHVLGHDGPANHQRLCVKGRYGVDYARHPDRLTRPLIRRDGAPKQLEPIPREAIGEYFREASWEEALDRAAGGLKRILEAHGPAALAGFGSAKGTNEEAYLFQKLVRTGFGSNNVDHCTRLCHASSVAALLECIGSGAVSNPVADAALADVIIVIGARPTVNHPVAATFLKNAAAAGSQLIVIDPYRSDLARYATHYLQFHPDTDVALLNALMYVIIEEGLVDRDFIARRTEGFDDVRRTVAAYAPERVAPVVGIDADTLRAVARAYATADAAIIFWGMGIAQHVHGTDNARCLIALALMTGQIGRPGTGLHPLRGQNNVQGASDVGLIPMVFPDYRPVSDPQARAFFERLWGARLDPEPGLTVVEIMDAVHEGTIRGMYVMGENPAMSDPNLGHAREALARLEHLVVQEIFFTETASYADVVLPASSALEKNGTFTNTDRRVQLVEPALDPPGEARQDLWIITELARRLGLPWEHRDAAEVFEEVRQATPSIAGITWRRLQQERSVIYPCLAEDDPGQAVLFADTFPTASGRGRMVPAEFDQAHELPDDEYPFVFTTGRQLEHWHTGAMTRHSEVLDALEPEPTVSIHPQDLAELGVEPGTMVELTSRRGTVRAWARADAGMPRKAAFMAFCYREAAANLLTMEDLDPEAKIPEFKFCAVRVTPAG